MPLPHGPPPAVSARTAQRLEVLIVDSAYTGEINARIGVAERLGFGYRVVPRPAGNPEADAAALRCGRSAPNREDFGQPTILLSGTGEDTVEAIANLRMILGERLFNVYLASILPDEISVRLAEYDLIASPQIEGRNVVKTSGVPHRFTPESLRAAAAEHRGFFGGLPRPLIGLLLGGNTWYCSGFDAGHAVGLARRVGKLAQQLDGRVIVSNSRRTPGAALTAVLDELGARCCHFCDWQCAPPALYPALLAHSDLLIVSGDSLSMCSEALSTGKPVLIDLPEAATEIPHRQIIGQLIAEGTARALGDRYEPWSYVPPDPTGQVADAVLARLARRRQAGDRRQPPTR